MNHPAINSITRAHYHYHAALVGTIGLSSRLQTSTRIGDESRQQIDCCRLLQRDQPPTLRSAAYTTKSKSTGLAMDSDSEAELEPSPWTARVWVRVSVCVQAPMASAVALPRAELKRANASTVRNFETKAVSVISTFLVKSMEDDAIASSPVRRVDQLQTQ